MADKKKIVFNQEAFDALKKGIDQLASAVKITLGPRGRNVILQKKCLMDDIPTNCNPFRL